ETRPYVGFSPTQPHSAAGCLIEPPVSDPRAAKASSAATAAAEPPLDPPGVHVVSQGFLLGPKAEFSVEDPIANSSMFNRPNGIAPAARSLETTVASYGAMYPSRILEAQPHGCPFTLITSLMEIGSPPRGRLTSAESASARARSRSCER